MASPRKKQKHSSADETTEIGEHEQQPMGSLVTSHGKRRNVRVTKKMNKRILRKIWICFDVWMDIFPFFDRPQLGLKLALLSPRFNVLIDKYFDGKRELTIWKWIKIDKMGTMPKLSVFTKYPTNYVQFPLPDRPLHSKIRFDFLLIEYIDHAVLAFLRANQHIWDRGTNLRMSMPFSCTANDEQPIWDGFAREIWPIFVPNIRRLGFLNGTSLDNLRHRTSPTILTDLNQLNSIDSMVLYPGAIGDWPNVLLPDAIGNFDDGPNATSTAGQALAKWLHTPGKDGKPKQLFSSSYFESLTEKWINNFKEAFLRAATSSSSHILSLVVPKSSQIVPFELVNKRTREKLTFEKGPNYPFWLLKRCPIGQMIQLEDENSNNWNNVRIDLSGGKKCIGQLSSQSKEKAKEKSAASKYAQSIPAPNDPKISQLRCRSGFENENLTPSSAEALGQTTEMIELEQLRKNNSKIGNDGKKRKTAKPDILADRMKLLLNTADFADAQFLVGQNDKKELLHAHRAILSASSDVFEAMFKKIATKNANGTIASTENEDGTEPLVPDVSAEAFKVMLRFIYSDDLSELNGQNAAEVLYAALKFNVNGLIKACAAFPISQLSNVFASLSIARFKNSLKDFVQRCFAYIDKNADTLIKSEAFLHIDQKLLCKIFGRCQLQISGEISIWNAALRWADAKCGQNGIECSAENRRAMLGSALFKIHFLILSSEEFSKKIVPSDVLSKDEVIAVYQFHSLPNYRGKSDGLFPMKFPTNGRVYDGTLLMDIEKVSKFARENVGSSRYSDKVYINGLPWKMLAQIKEKTEGNGNEKWLGIFYSCDTERKVSPWRCCVRSATFRIVSHKNGVENSIGTLIDHVLDITSTNEGFPNFISFAELMDSEKGFYNREEDKVTLAIDVTVTTTIFHQRRKYNGTLFMEIEKVSQFAREVFGSERKGETVTYLKGLPWKILAQIRRKTKSTNDNEKYLGIFYSCDTERKDLKVYCCVRSATFRIVSQKCGVADLEKLININWSIKKFNDRGFENFILLAELMDPEKGFYNKSEDKVQLAIDLHVEALVPVPVGTPPASFTLLRDRCLEQMENNRRRGARPLAAATPNFSAPQFINQHPMAGDVRQGSLGDCWALAAASVLAQYGALFYRPILLEKAYAKIYGGYKVLFDSLRATTSTRQKIPFVPLFALASTPIVPFELVNERTNEKLTLKNEDENPWGPDVQWTMKRRQIGANEISLLMWEGKNSRHLDNVHFSLFNGTSCIGHYLRHQH
ncbi:hypothetical protein niasHT_010745 [Heterodera trifolii]|uniref:BTB domain-containing protein n=1 Tax=Heterodera trifolii TaxID=157864 RepID=A0ABD2LDU6_9BILA